MCTPRSAHRRTAGGFSLLELVLVVAILTVIGAIAMPRYADAAARYRADLAARRVAADLAMVQAAAYEAGASRSVLFDPVNETYSIAGIDDLRSAETTYRVRLDRSPYEVDLTSADFAGAKTITFNGHGVASTDGAIVLGVGAASRTISIDLSGRISVQ